MLTSGRVGRTRWDCWRALWSVVSLAVTGCSGLTVEEHSVDAGTGRIKLRLRATDADILLDLQRNDHVTSDVPIYVAKGGKVLAWKSRTPNDFVAYTDVRTSASILVTEQRRTDNTSERSYSGSFHVEGVPYMIEPVPIKRRRSRRSLPSERHLVYKRRSRQITRFVYDGLRRPGFDNQTRLIRRMAATYQAPAHHQLRYCVETLVCLDYPIYKRWLARSRQSSQSDAHDEAIKNIRYFYSHVYNQIDMRFRSIQVPDYRIFVVVKAFFIATEPSDSYWTEHVKIPSSHHEPWTNAERALDLFEAWINRPDVQITFGPFDHAALFTGYRLTRGRRLSGVRRNIGGLAMTRGVCTENRASIMQQYGQFNSAQNAAHELGHSLGALHDGNADNSCSMTGQFIMASYPEDLTEDNYLNAFFFSNCSIEYFRNFLLCLRLEGKNCLVNDEDHNTTQPADELRRPGELPGQRFQHDDQCTDMAGPGSYYCRGEANDKIMCKVLVCYSSLTKTCEYSEDNRAYDGTVCGDRKWCLHGFCETDPEAPAGSDTCVSGDYPWKVYCSSGTTCTCPEMGREEPWDCYDRHKDNCCQTCGKLYDRNRPGCEYGDHGRHCNTTVLHQCYKHETRASCCKTCTPPEGAPRGCEFGDRGSHCDGISLHDCYTENLRVACCHTCQPLVGATVGCEFGNRHPQCSTIRVSDCYSDSIRRLCCSTCTPPGGALHGCEFGNRGRRCSDTPVSQCYSPSTRRECCQKCQPTEGAAPGCEYGDRAAYCHSLPLRSCYSRRNHDDCCKTCQPLAGAAKGCEFGDRAVRCDVIEKRECYVNRTRTTCCKTCRPSRGATVGCEYGDSRGSWCTSMSLADCYQSSVGQGCCQLCRPIPGAKQGCEYGDREANCATRKLSDCYTESVGKACCDRCQPIGNATSGCEFGDRGSECSSRTVGECSSTSVREACCQLCQDFVDTGGGCPAGDRMSRCRSLPARECYMDDTRASCCQRCRTVALWGATPGCEYGDRGTSCSSVAMRDCYKQATRASCCLTCRPQEGAPKGCEFGDRQRDCASRTLVECYTSNIRKTCCATCRPLDGATKGCEFGDKASWCSQTPTRYCYFNSRICCRTCAEKANPARPKCMWGDRLSWCASIRLNECYRYDQLCCERCRVLRRDQPKLTGASSLSGTFTDCPYGDRSDYCHASQCKERRQWRPCCHTCRADTKACLGGDLATWCRTAAPSMCYSSWHICCKTCPQHRTGDPACLYGDRLQWCKGYVSVNRAACDTNEYIKRQCCASCPGKT